jgi:heme/copper-type cytochrome/quinol oxidase subunit 4
MLLLICILIFILFSILYSKTGAIYALVTTFLAATFYGSSKLLEITRNYIYFIFSILFTALPVATVLVRYLGGNNSLNLLYIFLFILVSLFYTALLLIVFHTKQNNLNEAPEGLPGKQGMKGNSGRMII